MAYELVSANNFSRKKKKKGFWPTTGGYVLKSLEMLERPSQALKVGIKETLDEDPEGFLEVLEGGGWAKMLCECRTLWTLSLLSNIPFGQE